MKVRRGEQALKWCQRQELNLRPKAYESSALPLSYSGDRGHMIYGAGGCVKPNDSPNRNFALT